MEVKLPIFLVFALDGCKWPASHSGYFIFNEESPGVMLRRGSNQRSNKNKNLVGIKSHSSSL